jgi:small ligand-binding sensory domain FIST
MNKASCGIGVSTDWQRATSQALSTLSRDGNTAFLFVTDKLAHRAEEIRAMVVQETGVERLSGTVGMGVCASQREIMHEPAVALLQLSLPLEHVCELRSTDELANDEGSGVAFVHSDLKSASIVTDRGGFEHRYVVGGLTASRGPSVQFHRHGTEEGGITGLSMNANIRVHTGLTQGCQPIGPGHRVTGCSGVVVHSLDERPALDVLMEEAAGVIGSDLSQLGRKVLVGIGIRDTDTNDFLARNLLGVSEPRRAFAIGHPVRLGDTLWFARLTAEAARDDMARMLYRLNERSAGPPSAGVYYSCVARGSALFGRSGAEVDLIQSILGPVPLVGLFGNGEFAHRYIHGHSGVLALFYEDNA